MAVAYRDSYYLKQGHRDDPCAIEIHVLDDENELGPVYPRWLVVFDIHGNVLKTMTESNPEPWEDSLDDSSIETIIPPSQNHWYFLDKPVGVRQKAALIVRFIGAPDKEHAIKVAADRRTSFLIAKAGLS